VQRLAKLDANHPGTSTYVLPTNTHPDLVDISHVRWATGNAITAIDLCAATMGRVQTQAGADVSRPGTPDERLHRAENEVSTLLAQVGKVNEATKAAIYEKLAEFDATTKAFAVKDISWALCGIGLGALGNLVSLVDKLST
jgi:hypothetical protein